jgi:hypothetical protein
MKDLQWTFEKRKADWQNAPKPTSRPFEDEIDSLEQEKFKGRISYWEQRRAQAAAGDIKLLGPYGEILATAAVRQYMLSYGPKTSQNIRESMNQIIRDFPGTPMASVAQKNIDSGFTKIQE